MTTKIKKFLLVTITIILFSAVTLTIIGITNPKLVFFGAKAKSYYANNFIPVNYSNYFYFKNLKSVKSGFENSPFFKQFKDNYIFQDFNSKYAQSVDMFFIKLDFNISMLLNKVNDDFLIGNYKSKYFLVASLDFNTDAIFKIFNMLPNSAKQIKYKKTNYFSVSKNNTSIFYSNIEDYVVITTDSALIESILDNYTLQKEDLYNKFNDSDIYVKYKIGSDFNKFGILPDLKEIAFKIDTKTGKIEINGNANQNAYDNVQSISKADFDILKLLPYDFPLVYVNNYYSIKNAMTELMDNAGIVRNAGQKSTVDSLINNLNTLDNFVLFGINSIKQENSTNLLNPELCAIFRFNDKTSKDMINSGRNDLTKIIEYLLGVESWETKNNQSKNIVMKSSADSTFSLIYFDRYCILTTGKDFASSINNKLASSGTTLYDKFYNVLSKDSRPLLYYVLLNSKTFVESIEPVMTDYFFGKIELSNDEYKNSFGQFTNYLKARPPIAMKLFYDKSSSILTGNGAFSE